MPASKKPPLEERDLELENAGGNYLIAQYQTSRLMDHLVKQLDNVTPGPDGVRRLKSAHIFKFGDRYYRFSTTFRDVGLNELVDRD